MNKIISNNNAFTLIETVIALGVLSIGILAMFSMQALGIRGNANANHISAQVTWGEDEIEKILSDNYDDIKTKSASPTPGGGKYTVSRTTTANSPMNDIKTIDVIVTNVANGTQVTFQYLKADETSF